MERCDCDLKEDSDQLFSMWTDQTNSDLFEVIVRWFTNFRKVIYCLWEDSKNNKKQAQTFIRPYQSWNGQELVLKKVLLFHLSHLKRANKQPSPKMIQT